MGMYPLRATLPMVPEPGSTGRRSSSSTVVPVTGVTVGPPRMAVLPGSTTTMPLAPPSDEPTASVITRLGKRSRNWSFTDGENTAAVDDSEMIDDRSRFLLGSSSRASINGRPMASPVIMIAFTLSSSTRRHTWWGSKWGTSTTLWPTKLWPITAHWVAPCIRGAMGRNVSWRPRALPRSTRSWGASASLPVSRSMPPPSAKRTSACRQTTPFGMPVVPPV